MKACPREGGELKSLPQAENCLRPGVTFDTLETIANLSPRRRGSDER
ncbi:MAG: hypothetical protein DDT28_00970 [Dehalococcoidia bacterium]|nr:hypothetical protein [Chloroflexota bacterium]MBT9166524.1 hypothetical protein [Chloroflexota bacterium]